MQLNWSRVCRQTLDATGWTFCNQIGSDSIDWEFQLRASIHLVWTPANCYHSFSFDHPSNWIQSFSLDPQLIAIISFVDHVHVYSLKTPADWSFAGLRIKIENEGLANFLAETQRLEEEIVDMTEWDVLHAFRLEFPFVEDSSCSFVGYSSWSFISGCCVLFQGVPCLYGK